MKKLFFVLLLLCLSVCVLCQDYSVKNEKINITLQLSSDKNIIIKAISNKYTVFIKEISFEKPLWYFTVKKNKEYGGDEITLLPTDGENVSVVSKNPLIIKWENVKKPDMAAGFDVTVKISIRDINSYWHINITPNSGTECGIWTVTYPYICNIYAENDDLLMNPVTGGHFFTNFGDERGFKMPFRHDLNNPKTWNKSMGYKMPLAMQMTSFSKKDYSLYLCMEDVKSSMISVNHNLPKPNNMEYFICNYPANMGEAGHIYNQAYNFNMAIVKGDWYNCAKKYRKWGIDHKYGVFANGKVEDRKDLPNWYKYNPIWLRWTVTTKNALDNVIKMQKFLGVSCGVHIYNWSKYYFDTHYPNWLPAAPEVADGIKTLHENHMYVMPYTNPLITDINQSPTFKKYGEILISKDFNGDMVDYNAKLNGADNKISCPNSVYYDAYLNEIKNIGKEYEIDALYMDQIGANEAFLCFDRRHNHPVGGGDRWAKTYRQLLKDVKSSLTEIRGAEIPVTTEDAGDAYAYDGWLRCNDNLVANTDSPVNMVVYSGYGLSFGDRFALNELNKDDALPAINKAAVDYTKGIQPGWELGRENEFEKYPDFGRYFKNMTLARVAAIKYLNFGEMVRNVKITSYMPTKRIYWEHFSGRNEGDFPLVRTVSFNYHNKTAVTFTNISKQSIKVDWESSAEDLNLSNKNLTVSKLYPKDSNPVKNSGSKGFVKSSFTIKPLETVVYIVKYK